MNYRKHISRITFIVAAVLISLLQVSCGRLKENLPECRLLVKFKYDYNMLSVDAFHEKVNKVDLYVFDEYGKFLFIQSEQGAPLTTGNYRMELELPVGKYKLMAWATTGDDNSYAITNLIPGQSSIEDVQLKLKRESSLIVEQEIDALWYGEILDVNFSNTKNQTETINLIKDTNKVRFIFMGSDGKTIDLEDYTYEIVYDNGCLDYDNSLLIDDMLSYRPYFTEQRNESSVIVEMNTMRLMANKNARFIIKKKNAPAATAPVLNINLIDYLVLTRLEEHSDWDEQQYLDREDSYRIVFILSDKSTENFWIAFEIYVNDYLCYYQEENNPGGF